MMKALLSHVYEQRLIFAKLMGGGNENLVLTEKDLREDASASVLASFLDDEYALVFAFGAVVADVRAYELLKKSLIPEKAKHLPKAENLKDFCALEHEKFVLLLHKASFMMSGALLFVEVADPAKFLQSLLQRFDAVLVAERVYQVSELNFFKSDFLVRICLRNGKVLYLAVSSKMKGI